VPAFVYAALPILINLRRAPLRVFLVPRDNTRPPRAQVLVSLRRHTAFITLFTFQTALEMAGLTHPCT